MLSSRIPTKSLAAVSRSLSTMLRAGIPIHKAFETAAGKSYNSKAKSILQDIAGELKRGRDVTSAVEAHHDAFPDLFRDMIAIGEETGALPEVLERLASHFENNLRLRREFLSQIAWPVFQLVAAIFVIAIMIWVLGLIPKVPGQDPIDPLGWGLSGTSGAITWLSLAFGTMFLLFLSYRILARVGQGQWLHGLLLRIPVIGHCMQAFAIARFSWGFALTQQAGMRIDRSLEASLKATSNGAFVATTPQIVSMVNAGEEIVTALDETRLFPRDYLQIVRVGEESGTIPEQLDRLSPQFEEQARRSLGALATAFGWMVWLAVAIFIIFLIFTLVFWYIGMIQDATKGF